MTFLSMRKQTTLGAEMLELALVENGRVSVLESECSRAVGGVDKQP